MLVYKMKIDENRMLAGILYTAVDMCKKADISYEKVCSIVDVIFEKSNSMATPAKDNKGE